MKVLKVLKKVWRFCLNLKQKAVFFGFTSGFCGEQDGTGLTFTGPLARALGLTPALLPVGRSGFCRGVPGQIRTRLSQESELPQHRVARLGQKCM